jgi:hypothetical protein
MKILSILIPTRNRPYEMRTIISILDQIIEELSITEEIEIIVSDNSDETLIVESKKYLRVIHTGGAYQTAEENLFSLLPLATGRYLWPLGDDEIPIKLGVEKLIQLCRNEKYEAMTWNSRVIGVEGEPLGHSRLNANVEELSLSFENFVERTGYWSVAAGISLTAWRNDLNNLTYLSEVIELESPIYSHVTYYLGIFHQKNFAFINNDLVNYQTNRHDVIRDKRNHWKDHASIQGYFYRYPWTLGMIRQLEFLEKKNLVRKEFFDNILDISHFGRRFKMAENLIAMLIEQRILEFEKNVTVMMDQHQMENIINYLEKHVPRYARTYEMLRLLSDKNTNISTRKKILKLNEHLNFLNQSWNRLPFHGFYRFMKSNFLYFETPLGWIAIKPNLINLGSDYVSQKTLANELLVTKFNETLVYALNGIEVPSDFRYFAESREELEKLVGESSTEYEINPWASNAFFLAPEKYAGNVYTEVTRARQIWNRLPLFLRKFIKRYFFT